MVCDLMMLLCWLMAPARGSIWQIMMQSGQPFLLPQCCVKHCNVRPLVMTDAAGELYIE